MAHCGDVFACWNSIRWHRVIVGGQPNVESIPEAQEALAENTLGGGMLREFGPGYLKIYIFFYFPLIFFFSCCYTKPSLFHPLESKVYAVYS